MGIIKGYSTTQKLDRVKAETVTVEKVSENISALSVLSYSFATELATDAVEAGSTVSIINATGHSAVAGNVIKFTSGVLNGLEARVFEVDTNTITLGQNMPSAPGAGDTFEILGSSSAKVDSSGVISTAPGPLLFVRDAVDTAVTEDTGTPANNIPLPVKLTGVTGDVNITAGDLNVQLQHDTANFDSTRIGDGIDLLAINADGSVNITDNGGSLTVDGAVTVSATDLDIRDLNSASDSVTVVATNLDVRDLSAAQDNVAISDGIDTLAVNADGSINITDNGGSITVDGSVTVSDGGGSLTVDGTVSVTDGGGSLTVDATDLDVRDLSAAQDNVAISDGTDTLAVNADGSLNITDNGGSITVDGTVTVTATDLDVRDLSAAQDNVAISDGTDTLAVNADGSLNITDNGGSITVDGSVTVSDGGGSLTVDSADLATLAGAVSGTEMQVDVVAPLPAGTNNIGDVDVLTLPSLPAGTNNIGDVDVLSLPALPAGANTIGEVTLQRLDVVDFFDTEVLDASVTTINGSAGAFVQVVASLAATVQAVKVNDTIGEFIGLYVGPAASEVLTYIIGPGEDNTIELAIPSGSRISLRNMDTGSITTGKLLVQFLG